MGVVKAKQEDTFGRKLAPKWAETKQVLFGIELSRVRAEVRAERMRFWPQVGKAWVRPPLALLSW